MFIMAIAQYLNIMIWVTILYLELNIWSLLIKDIIKLFEFINYLEKCIYNIWTSVYVQYIFYITITFCNYNMK